MEDFKEAMMEIMKIQNERLEKQRWFYQNAMKRKTISWKIFRTMTVEKSLVMQILFRRIRLLDRWI